MQEKNVSAAYLPRQCEGTTKSGQPCRGYAIEGSRYCFAHDPARAADRARAHAAGGKARHGRKLATVADLGNVDLGTTEAALEAIGAALRATLELENTVARNRCIGFLATAILDALRITDLDSRITAIEAKQREVK